jgi:hypothetical protein
MADEGAKKKGEFQPVVDQFEFGSVFPESSPLRSLFPRSGERGPADWIPVPRFRGDKLRGNDADPGDDASNFNPLPFGPGVRATRLWEPMPFKLEAKQGNGIHLRRYRAGTRRRGPRRSGRH